MGKEKLAAVQNDSASQELAAIEADEERVRLHAEEEAKAAKLAERK